MHLYRFTCTVVWFKEPHKVTALDRGPLKTDLNQYDIWPFCAGSWQLQGERTRTVLTFMMQWLSTNDY